jgi:hypothetical protein
MHQFYIDPNQPGVALCESCEVPQVLKSDPFKLGDPAPRPSDASPSPTEKLPFGLTQETAREALQMLDAHQAASDPLPAHRDPLHETIKELLETRAMYIETLAAAFLHQYPGDPLSYQLVEERSHDGLTTKWRFEKIPE